uniref:Phytosulfokine-beta n=1 Tax=Leersia perrieri TaxID=77586 RepID=A0A0D9WSC4_9ORYZ
MVNAGRTARAVCLLCLVLFLLAQDAHSRKLLLQEKQNRGHGVGNGTTTTQEPSSTENGGSTVASNNGQLQFDSAKWAEFHTDYIYTQDVKNP